MFLELAEHLKCPQDHQEEFLVVATGAMKDRAIVFGTIGCPVCSAEYTIVNRIAQFGQPEERTVPPATASADAVQALVGLESPGGYVVLIGSAASLAVDLADRMEGVHFIGINAPEGIVPGRHISLLSGEGAIPLKAGMARSVVIGAEYADPPWLAEAVRVLLPGLRLVVLAERVAPDGVDQLAVGDGMWVGKKR